MFTGINSYKSIIKALRVKDEYLEKIKKGVTLTFEEKLKIMQPFIRQM